ncbi:HepT-like ribonuclease domain-containing protein [Bradyrhizobium sp. USDA 4486]
MPPTVEDRLRDILEAITDIEDVVKDLTFDQFVSEKTSRLAVERLLEIIGEASKFIPDEVKRTEPGVDWRKMIDFGSLLASCLPYDEGRDRLGHRSNPPSTFEVLRRETHSHVGPLAAGRESNDDQ